MKSKNVIRFVLTALLIIILLPIFLYLIKLDWSRQHSSQVNQLPQYSSDVTDGSYRLQANDLEFLIRIEGWQNDGPTAVLLHGFPESSIMWSDLSEAAANEGFRVLSFDQRGYSPGARPKGKSSYHIDSLVADVMAVTEALGIDSFHLVGHDWGAVVGWKTVMDFPENIKTWTALTIPHIGVFFHGIINDPEQKKRSAYIDKLKIPLIPEMLYLLRQEKFYEPLKETWTAEQIQEYQSIQNEPRAITSMMNWYRALDNEAIANDPAYKKRIDVPTLFMLGDKDKVVAPSLIPKQVLFLKNEFKFVKLDAGHSLMQMKADTIIPLILDHWSN